MYNLKDIMEMFQIPERTIRRHIKEGILVGRKVGGIWEFSKKELEDYLGKEKLQKYIVDKGFKEISDFYGGYIKNNDEVIYMLIKNFELKSSIKRFMGVTSLFEHNFTFNCHKAIGSFRYVFKGQTSDVLILMKWSEEFEENI